MKQFFLTLTFVGTVATAYAQKNSLYIGGQAGFNFSSTTDDYKGTSTTYDKDNSYSFSPEVGTFLTNQVQLGVGFTFSGSRKESPYTTGATGYTTTTVNRYGGTVYSRYFFGEGNFRPFVGVNVSVLPGNGRMEPSGVGGTTSTSSTFDFGANLNAGFGYGLTKRLTVVGSFGSLGFQSSSTKQDATGYKTTTNSFGLDANTLGNRFTVGVYYTLRQANAQ